MNEEEKPLLDHPLETLPVSPPSVSKKLSREISITIHHTEDKKVPEEPEQISDDCLVVKKKPKKHQRRTSARIAEPTSIFGIDKKTGRNKRHAFSPARAA